MIKNTEEHSQPKKNTHSLLVLKVTPKIWKPASHQRREITRKYVFMIFEFSESIDREFKEHHNDSNKQPR